MALPAWAEWSAGVLAAAKSIGPGNERGALALKGAAPVSCHPCAVWGPSRGESADSTIRLIRPHGLRKKVRPWTVP